MFAPSGDSYRVEKSGDETSGFVTTVVMTDNSEKAKNDESSAGADGKTNKSKNVTNDTVAKVTSKKSKTANIKSEAKSAEVTNDSFDKPLNKRQRQQLKRKARLEAEATEKRKRQNVNDDQTTNSESPASKPNTKLPQHQSASIQNNNNIPYPTEQDLLTLQTAWTTPLHTTLLSSLYNLGYTYPTPIQSATLSAAILGRRDIVGAAPTGSGKTLSYGLPILQWLLEQDVNEGIHQNENDQHDGDTKRNNETKERLPLQALILVPTREVSIH